MKKPDIKKSHQVIAAIWVCGVVLLVVFHAYVIGAQEQSIAEITQQIAEKEQHRELLQNQSLSTWEAKQMASLQTRRDTVAQYVGDFDDSSSLTFLLSAIARESNVDSFASKSGQSGPDAVTAKCTYIKEQHASVSFGGVFADFVSFLNALERNQPVVFVDKFSVKPQSGKSSHVDADMSLSVFVKRRADSAITKG